MVLSNAGDQLPVMPFFDELASVNDPPEQIAAIGSKVGIIDVELTNTVSVAVVAHCPAVGVKV